MAKFKKGDWVESVSGSGIEYLVIEVRGGGWFKIANEGNTWTVRGNILRLKSPREDIPSLDDREVNRYAAALGRRGGKKSRRTLTPDQARKMVKAREKKKLDKAGTE